MLNENAIIKKPITNTLILIALIWPAITTASVVRMETILGDINIELYDSAAPLTVSNFMNYVNDGDYSNSIIHRSEPGFVIQGGGFTFDDSTGNPGAFVALPQDAPIVNEYGIPNTRGTIAMARLHSSPDSATSQWFINLVDNTEVLGSSNSGGYAVFGQVLGNGMDIVDAIAGLPTWGAYGVSPSIPVVDFSPFIGFQYDDLVIVNSISVVPIPIPAAIWLFGSGLVGLIGFSRRRK
ncbi:MAG: peptidylprolyl isomerase [Gammaproteobacteria bacterium]|nr:peptidylprolyl isomerase [Gammaproteobacteria bacterium]